jgi:GWxTD domain-containing protein
MKIITLLLAILLFASIANAQTTQNWDLWLRNEGYYLLGPKEKEKFATMTAEQKEIYVEDLWNSLDPDQLTPENEFQQEYMKRFAEAKKKYSIPSDRAKIYILLGKPNSVETYPNSDKYYPLELWSYYSLGFKDLPSSLDLIFFKRWGAGDYRLYSPLFDGMKALTPSQMDFDNPKTQAMLKA